MTDLLKQITVLLQGKKTYAAVAALMAYMAGAKYGIWPLDAAVATALGGAAVVSLRSAMGNNGGTGTTPLLIAALSLPLLFTGCATSADGSTATDTEKTLRRVGNVTELAAYTGTTIHLTDNPHHRPIFETAVAALGDLSSTNNFDPIMLAEVLQMLPIRELQDPKAKLIIGSAIMLYEFELKELIPVDQPLYVAAVLQRLRSGISRGLAAVPN